mgnify:CR=1 FL=1
MIKKRVAIHQKNFIPWVPYFYKMAMADIFIFLDHVQFEKNGYQNRFMYKGKWITKPVEGGVETINSKNYVGLDNSMLWASKGSVAGLNELWIRAIQYTLNIKTRLVSDFMVTEKNGTERLIELIKFYGGNVYITNPEAKDKYLDEDKMKAAGIEIEYCVVPRNLKISIFEAFETFGIEGTIKQLPKMNNEKPNRVLQHAT